jgi:hypothetical protein
MVRTQQELDRLLDRQHTARVIISDDSPLPEDRDVYDPLWMLPILGFSFTPRELLHAIGCKTAALPLSAKDECLKSAWLYTNILDLEGPHLSFKNLYGSDLQIARSQEIGIGMMCLIAERYFNIPWDQLGPLPGRGKRFDYRGHNGSINCIFESKGTSHIHNQSKQIDNGIEKKNEHHARGDHFDVELIISSYIGQNGGPPRIVLADPDKSSLKELYFRGDDRYFRLRHYCRVLQYVGLPESAFKLNQFAREYLDNRLSLPKTILDEKRERGFLQKVTIEGDEFFGRWHDSWLPKDSTRYARLIKEDKVLRSRLPSPALKVFQGLRRDIYESGLSDEPFSHHLIKKKEINTYRSYKKAGVSVFPDGTVMIFRQE